MNTMQVNEYRTQPYFHVKRVKKKLCIHKNQIKEVNNYTQMKPMQDGEMSYRTQPYFHVSASLSD